MRAGDVEVMVARILGILGGVAISLTTAVCLLPQSATHRALVGIKQGLEALVRLSEAAWCGPHPAWASFEKLQHSLSQRCQGAHGR